MAQEQKVGPVTLDDVRQALGEVSAFETNANKLREIIGRGSFATIQKHLEAIRTECIAAAQPPTSPDVPQPPADLMASLWTAAYAAAQVKTLARLEKLSAERDDLQAQAQAQAADLVALTAQLDTLDAQAQTHASLLAAAEAVAKADADAARETMEAQASALLTTQSELAKVKAEGDHAAALAARDAQIERQTLQNTIDRLTDQISELKALRIVTP